MATNHSLLNFYVIFYILSIWYNTVVATSDESENMDTSEEFSSDSEDSNNQGALNPMQKWHIDTNIKNLTYITKKYINNPTKMITELMIKILGKNMLQNMTPKIRNLPVRKYAFIPENVQNFVFEYVNLHARPRIDNSTFIKKLKTLCKYIRRRNRGRSINRDSEQSNNQSALNPMQAELLQKWHIDANIENLTHITNEYINSPRKMTTELLRMILGNNVLRNMTINENTNSCVKYNLIPENVQNFVFEYVNLHARSSIDNSTFFKTVRQLCLNVLKGNSLIV
ncbi:uncharacterized protein LOC122499578 isoform X3 [Leptopilina heterotoma]|uniref:uncharacterized protein LOC122499578 isoform X3 n=1 Tax=Leptopilina heterotoma TaxID=63436 RepID=UPI001CA90C02|nr:uncharacterized protein LOC122499578 isoform X3 [Leptopilina heterotoma]